MGYEDGSAKSKLVLLLLLMLLGFGLFDDWALPVDFEAILVAALTVSDRRAELWIVMERKIMGRRALIMVIRYKEARNRILFF
jgi:hypothetical protein